MGPPQGAIVTSVYAVQEMSGILHFHGGHRPLEGTLLLMSAILFSLTSLLRLLAILAPNHQPYRCPQERKPLAMSAQTERR
jgi:hypothetical protein